MKTISYCWALLALAAQAQPDPYAQLPAYDFGKDAAPVTAITQEVFETAPVGYAAIEAKLLAVLAQPESTYAARKFICEQLRVVGSAACIDPLTKLLQQEETAPLARIALETLPGAAVEAKLLEGLASQSGKSRIGLIQTLAARRCQQAVPALQGGATGQDLDVARSALQALARISGNEGTAALRSVKVAPDLEPLRQQCLMDAAFVLAESGDRSGALRLFEDQWKTGSSVPAVIAACNGIVASRGADALAMVLSALRDPRPEVALAAAQTAQRLPGDAVARELSAAVPGLSSPVQVAVVRALAQRGERLALPAVKALLDSPEDAVKAEAALALESLGDASVVPGLIALASGSGEVATSAQQTLGRIHAEGVDETMARMLDDPDAKKVRMAALTLKARASRQALPRLLALAASDQADLRNAALEALDGFAGPGELPALLAMLDTTKSQDKLVSVIWKATTALGTEEQRFVQLWGDGSRHAEALIGLASVAGGEKPLQIAVQAAASPSPALQEAAARALFGWKTDAAIAPVMEIVKSTREAKLQILGARAVARLTTDKKCSWKQEKKLEALRQLLALLSRPEDKTLIEGAIAKVESGTK